MVPMAKALTDRHQGNAVIEVIATDALSFGIERDGTIDIEGVAMVTMFQGDGVMP